MRNAGYFRYPSIAGDRLAFVAEDDAWIVDAAGGVARRLTAGLSEVTRPVLSPDGRWLAFASRDEHHLEVYTMALDGGPARRVTWLGANAIVRGWLSDGRVLFISDHRQPFPGEFAAYAMAPEGGEIEALPYGPTREVAVDDGGAVVLGRNTADPARWKRYRGGTAGELWIDPRGSGTFKRLLQLPGNLAGPMWVGGRVYFLSDHEGMANIYSCRPTGRDLRRHTDHDRYYARWPHTDGARIVYQHAAELWLFDPASDTSSRVDVDFASPRAQRSRKFVPAERYLTDYAVHPDGRALAVTTRGKLFSFPLWEEAVRQHGERDGVRYRSPGWLGDGGMVVLSDEGGEDAVEVHTPDGERRRFDGLPIGCITSVVASPTGRHVAVTNEPGQLAILEVESGEARVVDHSPCGGLDGVAWSPDGAWVAYSSAATPQTRSIKLCEVASGECTAVTPVEFRDHTPAFDPGGRFLYFLSARSFDPMYDSVFFDLGFPHAVKPCLVVLRADAPSPFVPEAKPLVSKPDGDENGAPGAAPAPVHVDLADIGSRVLGFPVPDALYASIRGTKDGKVLLLSFPAEGSLGRNWSSDEPPTNGKIEVFDFDTGKPETVVEGVTSLDVSADGTTVVYAAGRRLRAVAAGQKPPEGKDRDAPGRASGWIDLGRVRVSVDPVAEWRQMLAEAWRLQRDHFWVPDMSGVDWQDVRARYEPLVEKVASRAEFSDLMWEMQGELGTSHAYEFGGDYRPVPAYAMGFLGADLDLDGKLWRVTRIVEGDPWDPDVSSPLSAPGVGVQPGDTILAVGGHPVGPDCHPSSLLVHQAGMAVELTVGDRRGRRPRRVLASTLRDETPLRYREWVATNRRYVAERSDGRVGYVHIPDMGPRGYSEFHRAYLAEVDKEALVVDVRHNGGGHVSALILEKLARRRIGFAVARWQPPEPYPHESPAGPLVAVTNEFAGSDGDIFTHCFKLMGLGPVVGRRTWGGVIGINPRHRLADGSITTQPEYSFWFSDVGWGVENYGTDPDYVVDIAPQDYLAGRDPQLDKALDLVQRALRRHRPIAADLESRPRLAAAPLPER